MYAHLFYISISSESQLGLLHLGSKYAVGAFKVVAGVPSRSVADLTCEVLVEESYFGGLRDGKRGRGAAGKVPVFGLLKRGWLVHTVMIDDTKLVTLIGIIRKRIETDSIVYTHSFRSYDVLDVSEFHHYRINYKEKFASERSHINGIENFLNQAKWHLAAYNGIQKSHLFLFLKECECRFNNRPASNLLRMLRGWAKVSKSNPIDVSP